MNVSFTRARKKLVIFGSRRTLQREPLLANFFELMQEKGWIHPLVPSAHLSHAQVFDVAATPMKRSSVDIYNETDSGGARSSPLGYRKKMVLEKENMAKDIVLRPIKKLKVGGDQGKTGGAGLLRGRPILRDLMGDEL